MEVNYFKILKIKKKSNDVFHYRKFKLYYVVSIFLKSNIVLIFIKGKYIQVKEENMLILEGKNVILGLLKTTKIRF